MLIPYLDYNISNPINRSTPLLLIRLDGYGIQKRTRSPLHTNLHNQNLLTSLGGFCREQIVHNVLLYICVIFITDYVDFKNTLDTTQVHLK